MKVIIFGATGMVGQGVLRECLSARDVELVEAVGRTRLCQEDLKLHQTICADLMNADREIGQLQGFDACFFCLGVSSCGMSEEQYRAVTYDLTLRLATLLVKNNPGMTFVYVSGAGTDSSEQGKSMWARVKGATENALQKLDFAHVYLFRPALIQPLHAIRSKTTSYRILYSLMRPLFPFVRYCFPDKVLTTEDIGRAMLNAARRGYKSSVLEVNDIAELAHDQVLNPGFHSGDRSY